MIGSLRLSVQGIAAGLRSGYSVRPALRQAQE